MTRFPATAKILSAVLLALPLAACGGAEDEYVPEVAEEGPGELIVEEDGPAAAVPVDVPNTEVEVTTQTDPAVVATDTPAAEPIADE